MQVIFLKDVAKAGRQFDVKNVADGYALNFLIPKGLAEMATKDKVASLEARKAEIAHLRESGVQELTDAIKKMDGEKVVIKAGKASEEGSLYKGVSADDIAEALSKTAGVKITQDNFDLDQPIKTIGEHMLIIYVGEAKSHCTLIVEVGE
jgi:large subunit ribosomal protein L9